VFKGDEEGDIALFIAYYVIHDDCNCLQWREKAAGVLTSMMAIATKDIEFEQQCRFCEYMDFMNCYQNNPAVVYSVADIFSIV
jgi:hypothetical protein